MGGIRAGMEDGKFCGPVLGDLAVMVLWGVCGLGFIAVMGEALFAF